MTVAVVVVGVALLGLVVYLLVSRRNQAVGPELLQQLTERLGGELYRLQSDLQERAVKQIGEQAGNLLELHQNRADQQLKGRQEQIDKALERLGGELERLRGYVGEVDRKRASELEALKTLTEHGQKQTELLRQEAARLVEVLSGNQSRGQWGERMAEDVLRAAGMVEGVQYQRQLTLAGGERPDFTFLLDGAQLHMDVKAPLASFQRYLEAEDARARDQAAADFIRDVRQRVKEVASRGYVAPDQGTVEFALLFIPTERVFGFINEYAPQLIDEALAKRVVICSPLTLFAVLAVVHQAARHAQLDRHAGEVLAVLKEVQGEWDKFKRQLDTVDGRLQSLLKNFNELYGTRTRQLERKLLKVEGLGELELEPPDGPKLLGSPPGEPGEQPLER